ncbi:hypothetical protein J472_4171, partial [Acinetobacter baumannii 18689]
MINRCRLYSEIDLYKKSSDLHSEPINRFDI